MLTLLTWLRTRRIEQKIDRLGQPPRPPTAYQFVKACVVFVVLVAVLVGLTRDLLGL